MKKAYKVIIFDLDGTLLNTLSDLQESVNYVLEEAGYPARAIEEVRQFVGNGVEQLMTLCVPDGKENERFSELLSQFRAHYAEHCNDQTQPYDDVPAVLAELKKRGYRLAIVSNKPAGEVHKLKQIYFGDFIETAVGEGGKIRRKPAPDTVLFALREMGAAPFEAVLIGDSEVDLETAANAGVDFIGVTWGFRSREELEKRKAALLADTPLALLSLID